MWLSEQYVYMVGDKYEDKDGRYARGMVSSPEKEKDGTYKYSRWFATFTGQAYQKVAVNPDIKSFKLIQGKISNAPYTDRNGEKKFPKAPTVTVIDIDDITYNEPDGETPF